MKTIDTFFQMTGCFVNGIFHMENWEKYANSIFPGLAVKLKDDIADYDFENDVLPLLNNVPHHLDKLDAAHQSFLSLTDDCRKRFKICCEQI